MFLALRYAKVSAAPVDSLPPHSTLKWSPTAQPGTRIPVHGPSSLYKVPALIRSPPNLQGEKMRFMMIMFPGDYENAKSGMVWDLKT